MHRYSLFSIQSASQTLICCTTNNKLVQLASFSILYTGVEEDYIAYLKHLESSQQVQD